MNKQFLSRLFAYVLALGVALTLFATEAHAQQELPLGSSMPSVEGLQRADGGTTRLSQLTGSAGTVVIFWSNQCMWVDRYEDRLQRIRSQFSDQGVNFVLINSNDVDNFPQESLEASRQRASQRNYQMTYVRDNNGNAARAFGAARTPHVYVFDENDTLVYVGAIDDSPGDPGNVQNAYLEDALSALVGGRNIGTAQTKAFGCTLRLSN